MQKTDQNTWNAKTGKMKINKMMVILLFFSAAFTACKKDDKPEISAPVINALEIGHDNNKTAYPGTDIHIEAELIAAGKLASVKVEISPKSGSGWKFNQEYVDGFSGLNNASFHKHIDVPADAAIGQYLVVFAVTDQQGSVTKIENTLEVKFDPFLPAATGFEVGINTAGNDLHMEATLTAVNKIAKVVAEVHGAGWEKEFEFTDAAMVGQTTYKLHKHLDVTAAPKGHYHVHLKIIDQAGKENEFEQHFDKP
ncbi:DUF4625 domain-containing protein [Pedobacter antarcticus]|uniref:DUF4625 domain-containing protein n=2 Tax=Pedobacter antarcticus TaxID=34086 RepID=A0A081PCQ2_9SPHI|nr:DUF4625 domain-containing protein [Pedobacter antarcticus]KEQ28475.1 hypothetical protein N180_02245 [Pedobacter antarcticus 4BY]SDL82973.1 protein of unknown function [Pedobacter antarcticus]SFF03091.1 protein of unknown function [Pedobacter antarcticus]